LLVVGWIWDCRPRKTRSFDFPLQTSVPFLKNATPAAPLQTKWVEICK
jgi:hypothetical protein